MKIFLIDWGEKQAITEDEQKRAPGAAGGIWHGVCKKERQSGCRAKMSFHPTENTPGRRLPTARQAASRLFPGGTDRRPGRGRKKNGSCLWLKAQLITGFIGKYKFARKSIPIGRKARFSAGDPG
ncbi:MAG: hypothetical protein LBP61_10390 [Desulfovibrio sp.]|nr:hypothetical protein [Desulfovibrio sp.]